jgi:hypothetical protein
MFQANLVQSVAHYPLSKLIPDTIVNSDEVSLIDYIAEDSEYTWGDTDFSLVEPHKFRKTLMNALEAGEFNYASNEIGELLNTIETLKIRNIHISLGE